MDIFTENLCYSLYLEEAHLEGLLSVKNVIRVGFALPTVFCAKDRKIQKAQNKTRVTLYKGLRGIHGISAALSV